jgi:hypothetical protein
MLNHPANNPTVTVLTPAVVEGTSTIQWEAVDKVPGCYAKLNIAIFLGGKFGETRGAE